MRELALAVLLVGVACPAAQAQAQAQGSVEEARGLFERALAAFDAGDLPEAERLFRRSLTIRRSGSAAFNLANLLRDDGRLAEAIALFREVTFLHGVPSEIAAEARAGVLALEPQVAAITIRAPDDPALTATVDDRPVPLNAAIDVDPGPHRVHVEREGRAWLDTRVVLGAGERREVEARVPPVATSIELDDAQPESDETWLWVTLSVLAVVLVGGGIALGVGLAAQPGCGTIEPGCISAGLVIR